MAKAAVFLKGEKLAPFMECDTVCIYERDPEGWKLSDEAVFTPISARTIGEIRKEMRGILPLAAGAEAVVCLEVAGIPFAELDRAGYCIFSVPEISGQVLDEIFRDIADSDEKSRLREEIIEKARPVETEAPGIYYLDLVLLQKECPDVSSKAAMREFLDTAPFMELHVDCAHIPPWLERDGRFELRAEARDGTVHLTLTKKQC